MTTMVKQAMNIHPTEDLSAFALGALDSADHYRVSTHLAICEACRIELEDWFDISAMLAYSGDAASPSSAVKTRLFALVDASSRPIVEAKPPSKWQQFWSGFIVQPASKGAILLVMLGLGFIWLDQTRDMNQMTSTMAVQQQTLHTISRASEQFVLANQVQGYSAVSLKMYCEPKATEAVLMISQVDHLPQKQYYQVWLNKDAGWVSVGRFGPNIQAPISMYIQAQQAIEAYDQLLITIEEQADAPNTPSSHEVFRSNIPRH
jgi:anti-sigma-K factor RskA